MAQSIGSIVKSGSASIEHLLDKCRDILLLAVRLYWGWGFVVTGYGKLKNLSDVSAFFASLGIPAPYIQAVMAGCTELGCGALLLIGLKARLAALPLIFTMGVAYATAHREELLGIFSAPDAFTGAAPFLFLWAAVTVAVWGSGLFSVDRLLVKK